MSFRDDDDDTSAGRMTQGGSRSRRGGTILWALPVAVILLAILIAAVTLPRKHAKAEEGTAPVSSGASSATPSSLGPRAAAVTPTPTAAPAIKP